MLEVNDIICAAPDASTVIEGFARLVGVDSQQTAYLIRIDNYPLTAPFKVPMLELRSAIHAGDILLNQQVELDVTPMELLSAASREKVKKSLTVLIPLLEDDDILFDQEYRGRMFTKRAKECKVSKRQIRRLYYQYLWGGKTELALAPRFNKCGGPGNPQKPESRRRGPKAKDQTTCSLVPLPDVRENLEKGFHLYYKSGSLTLEEAFMETKKKYFSNGARIERGTKVSKILLPPEKLPSLGQFRHVCKEVQRSLGLTVKVARRIRQKTPDWKFRGRSRDGVLGPGFRFEIDATKIQIRLVSRWNRAKVLKNATLYVIVDIWSGAIVGYSLSLQNASWALAAKALHNCFTDKQEVFDRLGLNYTGDEWPCHHLPVRLAADRAELISDKARFVPELGIVVEIMPPMCPERKGKVESSIKNVKHGHSHRLPGRHAKYLQRRENDGIDSAALTIDELERIIVEIIMGLNQDPVPESYIPPEMIEAGETDVSHINLYRWGIQHYCGFTRKLTSSEVYTHLMTTGVASLTSRGLYFKSQTFVSPAVTNAVIRKRSSGKGFIVDIRYDEHRADCIWFLDRQTNSWVQAVNMDENIKRRKAGFYELEIYRDELRKLRRATKDESLHFKSESDKEIKQVVKQSEAETKEDMKGVSKSGRKKNMRENTLLEIETAKMMAAGAATPAPTKVEESEQRPNIIHPIPSHQPQVGNSAPKQSIADISLGLWEKS